MKKSLKRIKNVYFNKIISLIILQIFLISTVNVYPADTNDNDKDSKDVIRNVVDNIIDGIKRDEDNKTTLKVTYACDVEKDILYITWNRSLESGKKYYVYKKNKDGNRYRLVSTKNGIKENFYVTTLKNNVGENFVVCESPELPKIPNDVKIYSTYDMGDYVGLFKELKGSIYTESNIIEIKLEKSADLEYVKKFVMIEEDKEKKKEEKKEEKKAVKKTETKSEDKKPIDEKLEEKLAKVKEEVKEVCGSAIKGNIINGPSTPQGFYWTDNTEHIEYKGIRLDIPKNSAPPKSFVYIKTLDESGKINNPGDSFNNTYGDGKGKIIGYDVNLFVLKMKDKTTNEVTDVNVNNNETKADVIDDKDLIDKKTTIEEYLKQYIIYTVGYEDGKEYYWEVSNKFINDIDVSIRYNGNTPSYINKDNAFVYYFDLVSKNWISMSRTNVDTKSRWVTGKTNHLCQFYSGTMNVQNEPPQAKGINTNPINIQAVDPLAGITSIAPPTPNNQGTANVSYPISVPEGINGLTPKVGINYSSEGGIGDCGYGWNLGTSKIERDTKKGVPKYDNSDRLYLDGGEIIHIANNVYRYKVEGGFSKIVKDGSGFIVYQTDGTKMYYGHYNNSKVSDTGKEYRWMLSRVEDKFGNVMNYHYMTDGNNRYLSKITYGYNDVYSVNFTWEGRSDKRESYISGFLIKRDLILRNIIVKYKENTLKIYELDNNRGNGAFGANILNSIVEKVNGNEINRSSFEYDTSYKTISENSSGENNHEAKKYDYIDINGDGLVDKIETEMLIKEENNYDGKKYFLTGYLSRAYINNGKKFNKDEYFSFKSYVREIEPDRHEFPEVPEVNRNFVYTAQVPKFGDLNGDGLTDVIINSGNNGGDEVLINNGNGLDEGVDLDGYFYSMNNSKKKGNYAENVNKETSKKNKLSANNMILEDKKENDYPMDSNPLAFIKELFEKKKIEVIKVKTYGGDATSDSGGGGGGGENTRPEIIKNTFSFTDVNCDGYADKVINYSHTGGEYPASFGLIIKLNKNSYNKETFYSYYNSESTLIPELYDYNEDGLMDIVRLEKYGGSEKIVMYNNGNEIMEDKEDCIIPYNRGNMQIIDFNGDGLSDKAVTDMLKTEFEEDGHKYFKLCGYLLRIYLRKGNEYDKEAFASFRNNCVDETKYEAESDGSQSCFIDNGLVPSLTDTNGDGLPDIVVNGKTVSINQTNPNKNILKRIINNKTGVSTTLDYTRANAGIGYKEKTVLSSFTTSNNELSFTTNIGYSNGVFHLKEKEFRGFRNVSVVTKDNDKGTEYLTEQSYIVDNEYYNTQLDNVVNRRNGKVIGRTKNEYASLQVLNDNNIVLFLYPKTSRVWLYDDDSKFIGKDEAKGDVSSETIFENNDIDKAKGLIKKSTSITYGDPHHKNDDVKSITNNFIDDDKWLCLPINSETIDVKNNKRISFKTIEYYDNGSIKKEKGWNNQENGASLITEYIYDAKGNVSEIRAYTDKNQNALITKTETKYIANDNYYSQVTATSPDGLKTITKFDIYGRGLETTDIYGDTSSMTLDGYGRVISIKEIVNGEQVTTKTFAYSIEGVYFKVEAGYLDNIGSDKYIKMQFYKDGFGRNVQTKKESMVNGVKSWVVSGYLVRDKMGRAKEQGVPTFVEYNEANKGYIDNKNDSLKIKTVFDYDAYGRFYKATMANGYWVTKEYGTIVENYKNDEKRIVSKGILKDSENRESIEYKDMGGAVVRTEIKKDKNSTEMITTNFEYDLHGYGKVTESTGAIGEKQFNSLGGLMWMKTPDAGKFEYVYNDKLQVVTVKDHGKNDDGNTRVINYEYDDLNRMIDIKYSGFGSNDIKYEYYDNTGDGNRYARSCIKKISKGSYFEAGYEYEQLSIDVKKTIEGTAYTTKFTYDVQGRIDNVVYPDGEKITYSYDEGGYLTGINGSQSYISDIKYNEYGQRTCLRYGNGLETKYEYTKETGLLDKMKQLKGAYELLSYDYDFDLTGNLTKLSDSPNGVERSLQNYTYDPLGRISKADGNYKGGTKSYNEAYSFDADNRILEKTFGNGSKYAFNYANKDHAITSIDITGSALGEKRVDFNYDDFGNMTKKTLTKDNGTSITEFKYDETNKLINIMLPNDNKKLEFKYDNGGQRIVKEFKDGCGTLSKNVYVNGFYELVNDAINKHISDGQYIFATKLDNNDENTIYYTQNNIGSTTLLTDKNGSDVGQFLYTPFGEMWVEEVSTVDISHITRFFTNQQYDKESGLYYYNARYYDPHLGSFLTPDPAMQNLNHYAYCSANPIKYTDPTGLWGGDEDYDGEQVGGGDNGDDDESTKNNETNSTNSSETQKTFIEKCKEAYDSFKKWVDENHERNRKIQEERDNKRWERDADINLKHLGIDKNDPNYELYKKTLVNSFKESEPLGLKIAFGCLIITSLLNQLGAKVGSTKPVNVTINNVTANRVRLGKADGKIAVVGRNMDRVRTFAKGVKGEVWEGFDPKLSKAQNLANNQTWAENVLKQGYTIFDTGLDPKYILMGDFSKGDFYGMETNLFFGDKIH